MANRNKVDWTAVPKEYRNYLQTEAQKSVFDMAQAGLGPTQIGLVRGCDARNVMGMLDRMRGCLEAQGHKVPLNAPTTGAEVQVEKLTIVQEHQLTAQNKALRQENKELKGELAKAESVNQLFAGIEPKRVDPIDIRRKKSKKPQVAATALLSDLHLDENVSLAETGGANQYNRKIAESRLGMFFVKVLEVAYDYMSGFEVVHLDLPMGGDMVSGNIHDELARSNEAEIMDTVDFWSEKIAQGVIATAKEFKTVHIPCVVGNHGRNTKKPRHKGRVTDNFDWLIYKQIERYVKLSGVKNVTFQIPLSTDALWKTMGHGYLLTHGDQASGGAGWGGIYSPIMRLYEKKLKAYASRGMSFDTMMMGHWHTFFDAGPVIVNGSLKGYDEFAHNLNFRAEPPQQAFWLTDPKHGKLFSGPLFVAEYGSKEAA